MGENDERPLPDADEYNDYSSDESGYYCDRCQYWYRGENCCPKHD